MKKNISYREQLIKLSKLYKIDEVKNYIRSKKNLTVSQIELILLKNKIRFIFFSNISKFHLICNGFNIGSYAN